MWGKGSGAAGRRASIGMGLLAVGLVGASCSSGSSDASSGTVSIAVEGPLTGDQHTTGRDMVRGARLAADQLNGSGGVLGRKITIVPADDGASASMGARTAGSMVDQHVTAVVGPFNSSVGVANLPIYRHAGVAIVRLTSSKLTEGFGVTTQPMDSQVAPVEEQELVDVLHARSVAVLYDPSTYTAGIAAQLRGLLTGASVAVPTFVSIAPGTDAGPSLAQAAQSGADWVYLAMYGPQAGAVAKQLTTQDPQAHCFVDLAAQGPSFVEAAGVPAGSRCLASGVPGARELPSGTGYANRYVARFGIDPGTWGSFAYDSVLVLAAAARAAGGWSEPGLSRALDRVTGVKGVTGTVTVDPATGNRVSPPVVVLDIDAQGAYAIDAAWAAHAGYPLPTTSTSSPG